MNIIYKCGDIISPYKGSSFKYRVIGPVCRLFDRSELPYPHCSVTYKDGKIVPAKGCKKPSWRRLEDGRGVGRQFIADIAVSWKGRPAYSVELIGSDVPEYDDIFTHQGEHKPYSCKPSDTLRELMSNRRPISSEELRSVPRRTHILPLYTEQLDEETKQWWYKNHHYKPVENQEKEVA